jgi:hypothetical protein
VAARGDYPGLPRGENAVELLGLPRGAMEMTRFQQSAVINRPAEQVLRS